VATTVQIDDEANALLIEHLEKEKATAARKGQPTRPINKQDVVSSLIKAALAKRKPVPAQPK
jgi:hypothetical protein